VHGMFTDGLDEKPDTNVSIYQTRAMQIVAYRLKIWSGDLDLWPITYMIMCSSCVFYNGKKMKDADEFLYIFVKKLRIKKG
jgi:hypothetical protein